MRKNILIVNDDGISAEGILVLAQAACGFGNVTVVAPASQCSAMSHKITVAGALEFAQVSLPGIPRAYSVAGTPADCVKAAVDVFLTEKPDVVLSGINHGFNVGYDVAYSGTVGAAMDALMQGIPAIAFSQSETRKFSMARKLLPSILEELLNKDAGKDRIWNVNFPDCELSELEGIERNVRLADEEFYQGKLQVQGSTLRYPALDAAVHSPHRGVPGTDLYAVAHRKIAIGTVPCNVLLK